MCFRRESLQGDNWCDSTSPFFAQNSLYRASFTQVVLLPTGMYMEQVNFSRRIKRSSDTFHDLPSSRKALLASELVFRIFRAPRFPFPANALTVSHPVKECNPISALHTLVLILRTTSVMSTSRVPVLEQHLIKSLALMMLEKFRSKINTSVSSELIATDRYPSWEACVAWSSRRVSASSWLLFSSATFSLPSSVIFQHSLLAVTNNVFPFSLLLHSSPLHSFEMNLIRLVLLLTL